VNAVRAIANAVTPQAGSDCSSTDHGGGKRRALKRRSFDCLLTFQVLRYLVLSGRRAIGVAIRRSYMPGNAF
jgi:hypothetical protein